MEEIFIDDLGNEITVRYDSITDTVYVNNSGFDTSFYEVYNCNDYELPIICIDGVENWEEWSDPKTRFYVGDFYWSNKKTKYVDR